jgi:hypothetical protein
MCTDPVVLRAKARKLRIETGEARWQAPMEKTKKSITKTIGRSLLRPFQLLIYEPMCLNLCLFSAILLGILYLFFGAFPLVFATNHGFNLWQVGLTFAGILVGMLLSGASDPLWHRVRDRLVARLEAETGVVGASEPEFRLPPAIVGSALVSVGLFWFGWTTYASVHWIVPIIGSAVFGAGLVVPLAPLISSCYSPYTASRLLHPASPLPVSFVASCVLRLGGGVGGGLSRQGGARDLSSCLLRVELRSLASILEPDGLAHHKCPIRQATRRLSTPLEVHAGGIVSRAGCGTASPFSHGFVSR